MSLDQRQVAATQGFTSYLESVGWEVIKISSGDADRAILAEEKLAARAEHNAKAVTRLIDELANGDPLPLVVASHSPPVVEAISRAMTKWGPRACVLLMGLREFLPSNFQSLQARGLQFVDLEHDANAFKMKLPREEKVILSSAFDAKGVIHGRPKDGLVSQRALRTLPS